MTYKMQWRDGYLGRITSVVVAVALTAVVGFIGARNYNASKAAVPGQIAVSPASAGWTQGTNVSVSIRENSGTTAINSVQFTLNYNSAQLQFIDFAESGEFTFVSPSAPTCTPTSTSCATAAGLIRVMRGMNTGEAGITGEHGIVTLNFKVLASSGSTSITLNPAPDSSISGGDGVNILTSVANGSYTVSPALVTDATLGFLPANGSYSAGATIPVAVHLHSPTQKVFSVHAVVTYPTAQLQFVSTAPTTAFPSETNTSATAGNVDLTRGIGFGAGGVSGDADVAIINFKVIGTSGTPSLSIRRSTGGSDSGAYDANGKNLLGSVSSATYTIPASSGGPTGGTGGVTGGGTTTTPSTGTGSTGTSSGPVAVYSGQTSYTSTSGGHISLNGDRAQVDGSVALTPVTDPSILQKNPNDTITKVEYALNGKLLATQKTAPYTYTFDTKKLRNGTYDLTITTFYASGTSSTSKQKVLVKNPVNISYVMTHYAAGIMGSLLGLIIVAFLLWRFVWPHFNDKPSLATAGAYAYADANQSEMIRPSINTPVNEYEAPAPSVITPTGSTSDPVKITPEQTAAAATTAPLEMQNVQTVASTTQQVTQSPANPVAPAPTPDETISPAATTSDSQSSVPPAK